MALRSLTAKGCRDGSVQRTSWQWRCFTAVCLAALLQQGSAICEYGSLPGMMEPSATAPFSLMWKLFDPNCQIKDELSRILGPAPWTFFHSYMPGTMTYNEWAKDARTKMVSNVGPQVKAQNAYPPAPQWIKNGEVIRMLVYGDSVDSAQVLDACREAFFRGIPGVIMGGFGRNCPACNFPSGLRIVEEFIPGVWPSGPYLDEYTDADAPQFNIPKGFQHLQMSAGDLRPHIVVFNANLWDLGRLHVHNKLEHAQQFLTPAFVSMYMSLLDQWLRVIEAAVPADTLLVYHNAAFPRLKDCRTGTHNGHEPLGHQTHVMQLNNAGRQVMSNRTRWHLVDYGQMSEATMMDFAHLRDGLHPNPQFLAQALNIILNLYREYRLALGNGALGG